jgi:hypothetical protein
MKSFIFPGKRTTRTMSLLTGILQLQIAQRLNYRIKLILLYKEYLKLLSLNL